MSIPESQLLVWAKQGATGVSSDAYNSIKKALAASSELNALTPEVHLQGSYANSTNIYGDSDIDVVVIYDGAFHKDMSRLSPAEQQLHEQLHTPSAFNWSDFNAVVLSGLRSYYKAGSVVQGKKSIKVTTPYGSRPADVVPALTFRRYATFTDANRYTGHWGIQFFDQAGNAIVNYPKFHRDRGEDKNSAVRTASNYKATVRLFKNLRNYMRDRGLIAANAAPSYFIECALHNVPDELFKGGSYQAIVPTIISYLAAVNQTSLMSQNGLIQLVGYGPTQWSPESFNAFVLAAAQAWTKF